jgi:heme/copper-type cytochrome/quinol oxidase subunit 2
VIAPSTGIPAALAAAGRFLAADWKYWLPPVYSEHGPSIDMLFVWIFWITTIIFFVVEGTLIVFLVKYRQRSDGRRATFTHGNTRLEMAWTLAPAVILIVLALATKRVWDRYRYSKDANDPGRAQVLVVGEQFKWNFVFPGPDGQLGTYLAYPRAGDPQYRGKSYQEAMREIGKYINETNPLGQRLPADRKTPDPGWDDDYARNPGRPLIVPAERTIDIHLSSKDVLHDFFLPTFRVKLDAVPGMRGHIVFKGRPEARSTRVFDLSQAPADKPVWLDPDTPGVIVAGNPKRYRILDPATATRPAAQRRAWLDSNETLEFAANRRLQRAGNASPTPQQTSEEVEKLKADLGKLGIARLPVITNVHEIVCEELCGANHFTMRGEMIMVSNSEYTHYLNLTGPTPTAPTKPATPPVAAAGQ